MNIVTLESSQYLETPQWRLSFQGLGRECTVTISFNGSSYQCSDIETEDSLSWIIQESKTPLELLFDLGRIEVADSFSFDISSEVNTNVTWILEALNSDESWSAGSQEIGVGDTGPLVTFEYELSQWLFTARAPTSTNKKNRVEPSGTQGLNRPTKVLFDASPAALQKLESGLVVRLLETLNQLVLRESTVGITASYIGQFETQFLADAPVENEHRNSLLKVMQSDARPEPLRRVVQSEVLATSKGNRLLVISDGSFLVSQELADLAESKDVRVELLIIGEPIIIAPLRESPSFAMSLLSNDASEERLKEICLFGI